MPRLIRVFAGCTLVILLVLLCCGSCVKKLKTRFITSLGEEGSGLCASRAFFFFFFFFLYWLVFVIFSFSWCLGLAVVCDCGTPWTFLLTGLKDSTQTIGKTTEFIFFFLI